MQQNSKGSAETPGAYHLGLLRLTLYLLLTTEQSRTSCLSSLSLGASPINWSQKYLALGTIAWVNRTACWEASRAPGLQTMSSNWWLSWFLTQGSKHKIRSTSSFSECLPSHHTAGTCRVTARCELSSPSGRIWLKGRPCGLIWYHFRIWFWTSLWSLHWNLIPIR